MLYFNPGEENFNIILKLGNYVDKTELILHLNEVINTNKKYICVSSPSGFGKTITVDMLAAYYSYSNEKNTIFDDKKISKTENWNKYLGQFNVIKLNMKVIFINENIKQCIKDIKEMIIYEVKRNIKNFRFCENDNFNKIIDEIQYKTNRKIVFIIDEWDFVLRNINFKENSYEQYLNFLYTILINSNISLVFITGILPVSEYEIRSDLKIFNEFTMISPKWMAKYIGFTNKEVKKICKKLNNTLYSSNNKQKHNDETGKEIIEDIQYSSNKKQKLNDETGKKIIKKKEDKEKLINKNKINYKILKKWYDGYQLFDIFSEKQYKVYSPYSITYAIDNNSINIYQRSNCSTLYEYIKKYFGCLNDIIISLMKNNKIKLDIESLLTQDDVALFNKKKKVIYMLVHLGYLGYAYNTNEVFIPNNEICQIFKDFMKSNDWDILNVKRKVFNPGQDNFKNFIKHSDYYVDKTELILDINKEIYSDRRNICVTRPRRFGKTLTINMLVAYYCYSESNITVFNDKKIIKNKDWNKYLGKFNVITLNMINFFKEYNIKNNDTKINLNIDDVIENINSSIVSDILLCFPNFKFSNKNNTSEIFKDLERNTGRKIVLIIDEWDRIFRIKYYDKDYKHLYMDFLNSITKDKSYLALSYLTGILPIKKYEEHSALNDFREYSMISPRWMAKYFGFTEIEVKMLCEKVIGNKKVIDDNNIEINFENIKKWYNGYILENSTKLKNSDNSTRESVKNKNNSKKDVVKPKNDKIIEIYNIYSPWSITEALRCKNIENFWNKTETSFALSKYINEDYFGLKESISRLIERKKRVINIETYQNDMETFTKADDVLTMFIHLGYLGFKCETKEVFIPNEEIFSEFNNCINSNSNSKKWSIVKQKLKKSELLLKETLNRNESKVAKLLEDYHNIVDKKIYNDESALKCTLQLAYYVADEYYNVLPELDTGKGYADLVYVPYYKSSKYPALVLELKYEENVGSAINQIKNRHYTKRLENYEGDIYLVGINYNKEANSKSKNYKHHTCKIEVYNKKLTY